MLGKNQILRHRQDLLSTCESGVRSLRKGPRLWSSIFAFVACAVAAASAQTNLTGTWIADDNGVYYLRQIGNTVWWVGLSTEYPAGTTDLHKGILFTDVFQGTLSGNTLTGNFADVPKGQELTVGALTLTVNGNELESEAAPGAYRATSWERWPLSTPPVEVSALFKSVMKNQDRWMDHTLLDNLEPAKFKQVNVLGRITNTPAPAPIGTDPYVVKLAYPAEYSTDPNRTYHDFICRIDNEYNLDGDLVFDLHVDRGALDQQIGFWSDGWITNHVTPTQFQNKLNLYNRLHIETVMYGGTTQCGDTSSTSFLVPGWQQQGALSALLNGVPINGDVNFTGPADETDKSSQVISILGIPIGWNSFVRINGFLVLDCGHKTWDNWRPCNEGDPTFQNQEIHPVYSIDVIQDFSRGRPWASLTGVWAGDDAGSYYVRQAGNTVWWLGLSSDEGQSFANVFQGTLQGDQVTGTWADVPLGQTANSGVISMSGNNAQLSINWTRTNATGGFGGQNWMKLYDRGNRGIVVSVEQVEASTNAWPSTDEGFEFQVGARRVAVKPGKPHLVKLPDGKEVMRADLPARIAVDAPEIGGLRMSAQFAGYTASWNLSEQDYKSGVRAVAMTPPPFLPTRDTAEEPGIKPSKKEKAPTQIKPAVLSDQHMPPAGLPPITIHYRIEAADRSRHDRLPASLSERKPSP
jgi:hypothetical protein